MNKGLKEQILTLYREGKSYNEITKQLDCAKSTVSYHCRKNGMTNSYCTPLTEEQKVKAIELYTEEGKTIKEIAHELNSTKHQVIKITSGLQKFRMKRSDIVVNWRKRQKLKLISFFGGKCRICSYDKYEGALHFHHLDPDKKDFTISGKTNSYSKLLEEAKKCILVCGNCHSEIHGDLYTKQSLEALK